MNTLKWLQWFAEGEGDGGASASTESTPTESTPAEASGESVNPEMEAQMSRIPERAKGAFKKAYEKTHVKPPTEVVAEEPQTTEPTHIPFTELIKSDEYKAEHKAYMDKTISDRFKGVDAKMSKMNEALGIVAQKYGLDPNSDTYLDDLKQKISSDDSYFEDYAMQHDMSVEEAKRNLEMEHKIQTLEAQEQMRRQQAENDEAMRILYQNADETKKLFPNFNLDAEMQSEKFRKMLFATGGDTTAAYQALHWKELTAQTVAIESERAKRAITNSIASGQLRPTESGLSNNATGVVKTSPSYKGMSAKEMREYAQSHFR